MKKTVKIELTEAEAAWVVGAEYGMFTPAGDRRVGRAIVRLLKSGVIEGRWGVDYAVAARVADALSGTEASDTAVRESIVWAVRKIMDDSIPVPAGI